MKFKTMTVSNMQTVKFTNLNVYYYIPMDKNMCRYYSPLNII